jgi:Zn-dependent protease
MRGSFRLGSLAGIDIKIHFTFPLILLWGALQWAGPHGVPGAIFGAALMAALFACVVLHEMGHSLVARRFGIPVREIILLPIGGVALLGKNPKKPIEELLIAIAGPAVNVVIAAVLGVVLFSQGLFAGGDVAQKVLGKPSLATALLMLFASNVMLVLFNLVPAFPMDGGRILRALLAMSMGFPKATRVAAGLGQILAAVAGVAAIVSGNIMLALVALFVFFGASGERAAEEARAILSTLRLADAYNKYALTLAPGDQISRVIDYLMTSYQPDFAVLHGGRLLGVVTRDAVLASLAKDGEDHYVTSIMRREVLTLDGRLTLAEAQETMNEKGAPVAAVFDGDRYLGLISLDDIREALQIVAFVQLAERRMAAERAA